MMEKIKGKTIAIAITLILALSICASIGSIPNVKAGFDSRTAAAVAAGMNWPPPGAQYADLNASDTRLTLWDRFQDEIPTFTAGVLAPYPTVGAGQEVSIIFYNFMQPPDASYTNDIRYTYTLTLTKPNGDVEKLPASGVFTSDSTGTTYTLWTVDQTGNWTVRVDFLDLFYGWYASSTQRDYYGTTFKASSKTYHMQVVEEPVIPVAPDIQPLPSEYWTRPIDGQNTPWYAVASNWLNNAKDRDNGGGQNRYQPDGIGPDSPHIVWTKTTEDGGLIGGGNFSTPGEVFNAGHQYQTRFTNQIIMWGRLYYQESWEFSGGGGDWVCVDLKTGEEVWRAPRGTIASPSFGYYWDRDTQNDHGIMTPGWLFSNNFGTQIHPRYGYETDLDINNVPSGWEMMDNQGAVLRLAMINAGNSSNPNYYLAQWNSSRVFDRQTSGSRDASTPDRFDWNVSIAFTNDMYHGRVGGIFGQENVRIIYAELDDVAVIANGSNPSGTNSQTYAYPEELTLTVVSLAPGSRGNVLTQETIRTHSADNKNLMFERGAEGTLIFITMPTLEFVAFDAHTLDRRWTGPSEADINPFGYFGYVSLMHVYATHVAYGNLYTSGYTGHVRCYDLETGEVQWDYTARTNRTIFRDYTVFIGTICDGKVYVGTHEHSADTPLFKGAQTRCLNATTGEVIWLIEGWSHPETMAIADGTLIYWDNYDHTVKAIARGPSATTVAASPKVSVDGDTVLVEGSVIDISPGTKQTEQAARFPDGVPAVSDESMSDWMSYVYMQKARPSDATGVEVVISVLDPNDNFYEVGRATSDSNGMFKMSFVPLVPGDYTVIASFAGSKAYWGSYAESAISVEDAPQATPEPTPQPASMADLYFIPSVIGIIIAIVVVGLLLFLLLRKR